MITIRLLPYFLQSQPFTNLLHSSYIQQHQLPNGFGEALHFLSGMDVYQWLEDSRITEMLSDDVIVTSSVVVVIPVEKFVRLGIGCGSVPWNGWPAYALRHHSIELSFYPHQGFQHGFKFGTFLPCSCCRTLNPISDRGLGRLPINELGAPIQ